jgi:hypothetical protein
MCGNDGRINMKVVINRCYGGFSLSREAVLLARKLSGNKKWGGACIKGDKYKDHEICASDYGFVDVERTDRWLVKVVELLNAKANGSHAKLRVVEIPDGTRYTIDDYDGMEYIDEEHQSWY